ncbi:hypothetical protein BCIN_13g00610 [Botrytis cinerea B05.10]|uniref:Uncharacterized protein n=1 Tax=Botryotinia fuckeliana (strain B05.10) TaxID=332648 RepID=A0A384K0B7_BOTFB|nr:hypothetical protein BCIN_13g00610 [Botrytis cinerea B05.10]ATZ56212.1 hypothetical protein BCIN_13g00610 [Botrytis cinerea B05.10]
MAICNSYYILIVLGRKGKEEKRREKRSDDDDDDDIYVWVRENGLDGIRRPVHTCQGWAMESLIIGGKEWKLKIEN